MDASIPPPPYLAFDASTRRLRLDPRDERFYQNPYEAYAWLHGQGSTFYWEQFDHWCFGGYDDVNRLLRDRRFGRQSPTGIPDSRGVGADRSHLKSFDAVEANSMLELEPPVHTRLRTLVNRAFVSRQVERLRPRVEALANELVDSFPTSEAFDLLPAFASPLPITIISEMLGVPVTMGPQLLDWSHQMVAMYTHGRTRETEEIANRAAQEFSDFLRGYVAERKKKPDDDLLSLLIAAQEDGQKLSEDELVSSTILLLNAGHEATVNVTGNGWRALLLHPQQLSALREDPDLIGTAVEELMRFDTPLQMFERWVLEDIEVRGVPIPRGSEVALLFGSANHDPAAFADPERLDITRRDNPHISFGAGIHYCLGAPLARIELVASFGALLARAPGLRLQQEPVYKPGYVIRGLKSLDVSV
jgi:cytochrome P450